MGTIAELVGHTAEDALAHATALQRHLAAVDAAGRPALRACDEDLHQLIGDIVSLRNAAELLKRSSRAAAGR